MRMILHASAWRERMPCWGCRSFPCNQYHSNGSSNYSLPLPRPTILWGRGIQSPGQPHVHDIRAYESLANNCNTLISKEVEDVNVLLNAITGKWPHMLVLWALTTTSLAGGNHFPRGQIRIGDSLELNNDVKTDMNALFLSKVYAEKEVFTCRQARAPGGTH